MSTESVKFNAKESIESLMERVRVLEETVAKLQKSATPKNKSDREMTDEDARRILFGDLKDMKHKEVAEKLGLSYGQVYSCRLEFTFKHIHKEMRDNNIANPWKK